MKKKLIVGILVGVLAMGSLAGCGGGNASSSGTAAEGGSDSGSSDSSKNMTLIMSSRDEFRSALETGAIEAAKETGISLTTQDAQNDQSKLIQYVETARNNGDAAVIICLVDSDAADAAVEAAGDMKVIFVNIQPSDLGILNENVVYVGSDEMQAGGYQGQYLAEYFKEQDKTDINYLLLKGTGGLAHTEMRTESALQALEDGGINATAASAPLVADYDRATAQDMITPLITTTEYDCIIANNDAMALGAIEALKTASIDPSTIPVVGIDATVDGLQAVENGELYMTVFQDADGQGYGACMAAVNLLEGKPINEGTDFELAEDNEHITWVPFEPVTADNYTDYQ